MSLLVGHRPEAIEVPADLHGQPSMLGKRTQIDGRAALPIHFADTLGQKSTGYFDVESGLLIATRAGDATSHSALTIISDYQPTGLLLVARTMRIRVGDSELTTRIKHEDYDPIDSTRFIPPASVRPFSTSERRNDAI